MLPRRPLGILGLLGLTVASSPFAPASAGAVGNAPSVADQHQVLHFTTTPPSGWDWYSHDNFFGFEYIARAKSSSGLRPAYSIAPASAGVCSIVQTFVNAPGFGSGAAISFDHAGTCTIQADQKGDNTYLRAPRVTQSFQIEKVPTYLSRVRGLKGAPGSPTTFSATLKTLEFIDSHFVSIEPFRDEVVSFSVGGREVCSGTTDSDGVAACQATLSPTDQARPGLRATYAGTPDYESASHTAFFTTS